MDDAVARALVDAVEVKGGLPAVEDDRAVVLLGDRHLFSLQRLYAHLAVVVAEQLNEIRRAGDAVEDVILQNLLHLLVAKAAQVGVLERRVVRSECRPGVVGVAEGVRESRVVDGLVQLLGGGGDLQALGGRPVGEQHVPNHVGDAVVGLHIGGRHRGALHEDVAVLVDADLDFVALNRLEGVTVRQLIGRDGTSLHDVVVEHVAKKVGVVHEEVDIVRREGAVGGGEDGERGVFVVQRSGSVRGAQGIAERTQVIGLGDDVRKRSGLHGVVHAAVVAVAADEHEGHGQEPHAQAGPLRDECMRASECVHGK